MTKNSSIINAIAIPDELQQLASGWYDGSGSMLYAITTTGGLTLGTIRPLEDGRPMTNHEWYASLFSGLACELNHCARLAKKGKEKRALEIWKEWAWIKVDEINALAGAEEPAEPAEPAEPERDDYVLSSCGALGGMTSVSLHNHRFLAEFVEYDKQNDTGMQNRKKGQRRAAGVCWCCCAAAPVRPCAYWVNGQVRLLCAACEKTQPVNKPSRKD